MLTQAKLDQLAVRLGLDDEIPQAPTKSVTAKSALLARVAVLRTAIELRLRGACCVSSYVNPEKPNELIRIDLGFV